MCLKISENWISETETFRESSKILIGYKTLKKIDDQFYSVFFETKHKIGKVSISDRESKDLTEKELENLEVYRGIHFYQNIETKLKCNIKNNLCPYLYPCMCLYPCLYPYLYRWAKFEIDSKDLIVVGEFNNFPSFVTMKAKFVEIINP